MLVSGVKEPSGIQNTDVQIRPREECYSFGSERFAWPLFMSYYVTVTRNEEDARDARMHTDATYDSIVLEDFCNHVK